MSQENDRQLPDGWQWVKLGDVCKIVNGSTPSSTIEEYWNGDIIWITPTDLGKLSSSLITDAARKITKSGYQSCNTEIVPTNSVIISSRAPIGYIGIANIPLCTNQGCKSLVVTEKIDTWFLYFWLKLSIPVLKSIGKGTTFQEISKSQLTIFEIPLPPLSEQKRIAAILNEQMEAVEKARKATEAQLEAAKALPAAYLRAVFESEEANSWERRKLGDVCDPTTGIYNPKLTPLNFFKYVDISSIDNTNKKITDAKTILGKDAPSRARKIIYNNDVLVATTRPNLNSVALVDSVFDQQVCSTGFCVLRADKNLDPIYLFKYVQSQYFVNNLSNLVKGSMYPAVTDSQVREQLIPLPPLPKQKQIASTLTEQMQEVERLKQNLKEQLDTINKLPAVLLRRAFKGEL